MDPNAVNEQVIGFLRSKKLKAILIVIILVLKYHRSIARLHVSDWRRLRKYRCGR